jgi:hypothetical protein
MFVLFVFLSINILLKLVKTELNTVNIENELTFGFVKRFYYILHVLDNYFYNLAVIFMLKLK